MADISMTLGLDTKAFQKGLAGAGRALQTFAGRATKLTAIAAGTATAFGFIIQKQAGFIAKLDDTSKKLGVNAEFLQKFRYAAEQSGVGVETADMALQRFTRRVAEAAQGTGEAKEALQQMGIGLRDSNGNLKGSETLLSEVSDALKNTTNESERVRLAFKLFDSEGVSLINTLSGGSAELAKMYARASELGIVLNSETVSGVKEFDNSMTDLKKVIEAVQNIFTGALAPILKVVVDDFVKFISEVNKGKGEFKDLGTSIRAGFIGAIEGMLAAVEGFIIGVVKIQEVIMPVFNFVSAGVNNLVGFFNKLPPTLKALGLFGFLMLGGRGKLIVLAISAVYESLVGIANSTLQVIQNTANYAIRGLNEVIEYVNKIPGVNLQLIGNVDFGEITPEKVSNKLDEILGMFSDFTELAAVEATTPIEKRGLEIIGKLRAYVESLKGAVPGSAPVLATDGAEPTTGDVETPEESGKTSSWDLFTDGWTTASDKFKTNISNMSKFGEELFNKMANSFTQAILKFAETGKLSFKDLFKTLMTELIKLQANKLFLSLMDLGSGLGTKLLGALGFRADGGPVSANRPYIVGEKGPELFMPSSAGTIVPNGQFGMGGGGQTVVNYNISAVDAMSFKQMVARDPEFIYSVTRAGQRRIPG